MPIYVCSKEKAIKIAPKYDFVISILDVNFKWPYNFGPNHLILHFDDDETLNDLQWINMNKEVKICLSWAKDKKIGGFNQ